MAKRLNSDAPLYHWAPHNLFLHISVYGLKIGQLNNFRQPAYHADGTPWMAPWICFGLSPADAYMYAMLPEGEYDLWQIKRDVSDKVVCRRDGGRDIMEVRIHNDIPASRVWYVGTRVLKGHYS